MPTLQPNPQVSHVIMALSLCWVFVFVFCHISVSFAPFSWMYLACTSVHLCSMKCFTKRRMLQPPLLLENRSLSEDCQVQSCLCVVTILSGPGGTLPQGVYFLISLGKYSIIEKRLKFIGIMNMTLCSHLLPYPGTNRPNTFLFLNILRIWIFLTESISLLLSLFPITLCFL